MVINHQRRLVSVLLLLLLLCSNNAIAEALCINQENKSLNRSQIILQCNQRIQSLHESDPEFFSLSISLAKLYKETGDLNSAGKILNSLLSTPHNISDIDRIQVLRQSGIIYFQQRQYEQAFNAFEPALSLSISLKDNRRVALGYNDLANIYHAYGDHDTAAKLLLKSYEIHSQEGNEIGQASVLNNLGSLYKDKAEYDEAIVSYRNAYTIYSKLGKDLRAAQTLSNLGDTFDLNGEPEKAIELLKQSASSLEQLNSYRFLADIYVLLAEISVKNNLADSAQQWLNKAKQTQNLLQTNQDTPKYWFVQGLVWQSQQELKQALTAFETAFSQIDRYREYKFQKELYTAMAELSEQVEDYQASSRYWRVYADTLKSQLSLKDAINSKHIRSTFTFEPAENDDPTTWIIISCLILLLLTLATYILWFRQRLPSADTSTTKKSPQSHQANIKTETQSKPPAPENLRQDLVELMHLSLQMWEESTQTGKLELAQQSKIWSVGIDDGRLRARAMERYFGINTLPQRPRWRSVVRTCNFVLQRCQNSSLYREELQIKLKRFQDNMKRKAIINSQSNSLDEEVCR
ncbi:tetratricopeptide repeat protein [Shewanella waksmanii]|uniref:tetratricopeptide repeat protein n=1 Tax=Shewanella waksmanii TaxID=213783 RepID=UPI00048C9E2D|nr:tetratricopeptide repeat protein [Shewanella waksmanii]